MGVSHRNPLPVTTLIAEIDRVAFGNWVYHLRSPIQVSVYEEDGLWCHEFAPLETRAHGRTREESAEAFSEHFSSIWHWIANSADESLGAEAVDLKRRVKELVKSVKTIR